MDLISSGGSHITYVAIASGFVYVAVVLDAWSRRVVGYAIGRSIDVRLTLAALKVAITTATRRPDAFIIPTAARKANSSGGRNALKKGVAMKFQRRRSDRAGRAPLPSPGRPSVAGRDERRRFWSAIAAGSTSEDAALGPAFRRR